MGKEASECTDHMDMRVSIGIGSKGVDHRKDARSYAKLFRKIRENNLCRYLKDVREDSQMTIF